MPILILLCPSEYQGRSLQAPPMEHTPNQECLGKPESFERFERKLSRSGPITREPLIQDRQYIYLSPFWQLFSPLARFFRFRLAAAAAGEVTSQIHIFALACLVYLYIS